MIKLFKINIVKLLIRSSLILSLLIVLTILLLPWFLSTQVENALKNLGAEKVAIDNVYFNPFDGQLIVNNLTIVRDGSIEFSLKKLEAHISWTKLFSGQLKIEDFSAEEIDANLRYTGKTFRFAGLNRIQTDKPTTRKRPLALILKFAAIKNLRVHFYYQKRKKTFLIGNIDISGINTIVSKHKKGHLQIKGKVSGGAFFLTSTLDLFSQTPGLQLDIKLENMPVSMVRSLVPTKYRASLKKLKALLNYTGDIDLIINKSGKINITHIGKMRIKNSKIKTGKFSYSDSKIIFSDTSKLTYDHLANKFKITSDIRLHNTSPSIHFHDTGIHLTAKNFVLRSKLDIANTGKKIIAKSKSSATLSRVTVLNETEKLDQLDLSNLSITNLTIKPKQPISIDQIQSGKIYSLNRQNPGSKKNGKSLLKRFRKQLILSNGISINNIILSKKDGVSIKKLVFNDTSVHLYHHIQVWPIIQLARETIKKLKVKLPRLKIASIRLTGNNKINIYDDSFETPFRLTIDISTLALENLSNHHANESTQFHLKGNADEYTKFNLSGSFSPFADKVRFKLQGNINEIDLPSFSNYTKKYYGYDFKTGQLDAAIDLDIKDGILSGKNRIKLRRLRLSKYTKLGPIFKIKLPIDSLVRLLGNSKNELRFTIPNKGNLYDPDFKMGISYSKALESGVKRGLKLTVKYAQPVGQAIVALSTARKLFIGLRLRPIYFTNTSGKLTNKSKRKLKKVSRYLNRFKKLTLRLCPAYSRAEIKQLKQEKHAIAIANQRGKVVKDWLVNHHKIESKRLFVCKPKRLKRKKSKPRVTVSP